MVTYNKRLAPFPTPPALQCIMSKNQDVKFSTQFRAGVQAITGHGGAKKTTDSNGAPHSTHSGQFLNKAEAAKRVEAPRKNS